MNKFTFKTIKKAGIRQIDEGYEFETFLKRHLYEFWGSDPTVFVYRYDLDLIGRMKEVEYPGSAISQRLDIIFVNIDEIQDDTARSNVATSSADGRAVKVTLGVCMTITAALWGVIGYLVWLAWD